MAPNSETENLRGTANIQLQAKDINYIAESMWTPEQSHSFVLVKRPIIDLVFLCCYNNLHPFGKSFHRFWSMAGVWPFCHKCISEVKH